MDLQSLNDHSPPRSSNEILVRVYQMLLDKNIARDLIDELDRVSPRRTMRAPIKQSLIEICARGRSIGVSLLASSSS